MQALPDQLAAGLAPGVVTLNTTVHEVAEGVVHTDRGTDPGPRDHRRRRPADRLRADRAAGARRCAA